MGRRKVLLDQLRKGLKMLGVLEEIMKFPTTYEKFFIPGSLSPQIVVSILCFQKEEENHPVAQNLKRYITESSESDLENFLMFTMATKIVLPSTSLDIIISQEDGFSSKTCFNKFHVPEALKEFSEFKLQLDTAMSISNGKKSFTMV